MAKTKYFCVSDLHGTHPQNLITALQESGFLPGCDTHKLVVAGDITDGLRHDESLINALRTYERQNQLIAIKGNHDTFTLGWRPQNPVWLSTENRKWLAELPYQINHKDFYLAHGFYTMKLNDGDPYNYLSTWGSPCLFELPNFDWWGTGKETYREIHEKWPTLQDYVRDHNDKPMIIGHFWPNAVKEKMDWRSDFGGSANKGLEFTQDKKGFVSINNIHYVDSNVLRGGNIQDRTRELGSVVVKVLEL